MFHRIPTYDPDELFRENHHIHTFLSRCGRREMTLEAIVAEAERAHLREIAITDHIHPYETPKLFRNRRVLTPKRDSMHTDVRVLLGAELSAYGEAKYTLRYTDETTEFNLYAHNHYHMRGWEQPEDRSPAGYKEHCRRVLENVIASGKADCFAHPFADKYIVREFEDDYGFVRGCVTDLWTENELGDLMEKAKAKGAAWELNAKLFYDYTAFMKRYFHIGKEVGVCFLLGTDAHTLADVDPAQHRDFFITHIL